MESNLARPLCATEVGLINEDSGIVDLEKKKKKKNTDEESHRDACTSEMYILYERDIKENVA